MVQQPAWDVVIVGGGIMGCATAYHLMAQDDSLRVAVVERDTTYSKASSTLSLANARVQFSLKENIQISQYTLQVLENFEEDMAVDDDLPQIGYHREGNLFLVAEKSRGAALAALELQQSLGCRVEWWPPERIKERYPLYEIGELAGGTFGARDGYVDAYALLMAYKAKARSLGAVFLHDEVLSIPAAGKRVAGVKLASGAELKANAVANCTGAWAAQVARTAGIQLPVVPVKRQVFALDTAVKPKGPLPLTVLPSGMYFRTDTGNLILLGKSMSEDPVGFDFSWDDKRFMEVLWPELAEFVPSFDTLKLMRGWAGLYAVNTLDNNAILGEWPELRGFFVVNGFSGHGLQQAPAVGRYIAELITERRPTLDLSIFGPERVLQMRPLDEGGIV
jgi:glycine/D-amino acid oxidase-like deaminating enzyme